MSKNNYQEIISDIFLTLRINLDTIIIKRMDLEKLNKKLERKSRDFEAAIGKLKHSEYVLSECCAIMESNL